MALKHIEHIVEGSGFIIRTDNKPLVKDFLQSISTASPGTLLIVQLRTSTVHGQGKDNAVAGALWCISSITMPAKLDTETISGVQGA